MMVQSDISEFEKLARPLIKYLNDKFNPHTEIIIDTTGARIVSGECAFYTTDFLCD
jgi:hypothetical protein